MWRGFCDYLFFGCIKLIKYHGLPITPETAAIKAVHRGHAFVSFRHKDQLNVAVSQSQSFAIDNGAFTAWRSGESIKDWSPFYDWALDCLKIPNCDWAVIPDIIDGTETDNDAMLNDCPLPKWSSVPVFHMHESLDRLCRLMADYPRIAIGSSGEFSSVGCWDWWLRINKIMRVACDSDGRPLVKMHGLRMLDESVFTKIPLSSADSTNIGQNIGIDKNWTGSYQPRTKEGRALNMRERIEHLNSAQKYDFNAIGENLCLF